MSLGIFEAIALDYSEELIRRGLGKLMRVFIVEKFSE